MSSKNTLQEFCIREKYDTPVYDTQKIGGVPHEPQWLSIVTLTGDGKKISVPGDICQSKILAEKSAATAVLHSLSVSVQPLDETREGPRIIILIDVENIPSMVFSAVSLAKKNSNISIYAFIGQHHHSAEKKFSNLLTKIIVPTTRKDGVDTFMQMFVGKLLCDEKLSETDASYAIVTRDHFGHSLAELIWSPTTEWSSKKAAVITTDEQLVAFCKV